MSVPLPVTVNLAPSNDALPASAGVPMSCVAQGLGIAANAVCAAHKIMNVKREGRRTKSKCRKNRMKHSLLLRRSVAIELI